MRILTLSNFYPPHYIGGYELGCRDVIDALRARGHEVEVLTSTYGVEGARVEGHVHRQLDFTFEPPQEWVERELVARLLDLETRNQTIFRCLLRKFQPDIVYIWNPVHVSLSTAFLAQRLGVRTCYFVSDDWLSRWDHKDAWYRLLRRPPWGRKEQLRISLLRLWLRARGVEQSFDRLDLSQVQFTSQYLKDSALRAGRSVDNAEVIHWGIELNRFPYRETPRPPQRLLYVGQLIPHKGVHTAIEAVSRVLKGQETSTITLTIAGSSNDQTYQARLRAAVDASGLADRVRFTGKLSREEMRALYREHDILLFPSIWDEPFGITPLEAMASGLAVVSTPTGGSVELMSHDVNALLFPKEDADACAAQLARLLYDCERYERIRQNGRASIEAAFTLDKMVDKLERSLLTTAGHWAGDSPGARLSTEAS